MAKQNLLIKSVVDLTKAHIGISVIYIASLLVFDAWKLVTPESSLMQWLMALVFLVISVLIWMAARDNSPAPGYYQRLVWYLICLDVVWASFGIYTQRGMSSRAVMLYALPIAVSAVLGSWLAITISAAISSFAYLFTAVWYFKAHPSEGYKIELYGTVAFYSAIFFILAAVLWILVRNRTKGK